MFFPRLRKQAKWMFVFLALVFAVGFVAFGVGSSLPSGIGDIFRNSGGTSSGPSESDARERIAKNPKDAEAYRELATALQQDGNIKEAIPALERYRQLRPKDEDALATLGSLYMLRAQRLENERAAAQAEILQENPGAALPSLQANGQPVIGSNPITDAVAGPATERLNRISGELQSAYSNAVGAYKQYARAKPGDPQVQLQLAQTALRANDALTAISASERFLKLAPDDPNAPIVRQQLKQLKQYVASQGAR